MKVLNGVCVKWNNPNAEQHGNHRYPKHGADYEETEADPDRKNLKLMIWRTGGIKAEECRRGNEKLEPVEMRKKSWKCEVVQDDSAGEGKQNWGTNEFMPSLMKREEDENRRSDEEPLCEPWRYITPVVMQHCSVQDPPPNQSAALIFNRAAPPTCRHRSDVKHRRSARYLSSLSPSSNWIWAVGGRRGRSCCCFIRAQEERNHRNSAASD